MTTLERWLGHARLRPLPTMLGLGALLFFAGRLRWVEPSIEPISITVVVASDAGDAEVRRATDEAMLVALAERAGFVERDSAIRARLEMNVRFVEPTLRGDAAIAEAMRLRMHESDPVVRARLLWLARETLARVTRRTPTDEELEAYLRAHPDRFARPSAISFEQVFVSRQRPDFEERVGLVAASPFAHESDPSLLPAAMTNASPRRIEVRFGRAFAEQLLNLEVGGAPQRVDSTYGAHFVRVLGRSRGHVPPLRDVRARVRAEWERDDRPRRIRQALERMRAAYHVEIRRS